MRSATVALTALVVAASAYVLYGADTTPQGGQTNLTAQTAKTTKKTQAKKKTKKQEKKVPPVLNFTLDSLQGKPVNLAQYAGKVVLIVNTASKCGFTPQYDGLQKLYTKYAPQGLVILGFPANDFGQQEPGSNEEIGEFCRLNYGVTFPMFSKVAVTGDNKTPLYKFLTEARTNPEFAGEIGWNFEKFLIGRDGKIVGRYKSPVAPNSEELTKAVEKQLAAKA